MKQRVARDESGSLAYILSEVNSTYGLRPVSQGFGSPKPLIVVPKDHIIELTDFEAVPVGHEGCMMIHYRGAFYAEGTPGGCIIILDSLRHTEQRIVLGLGNTETGQSWEDVSGRVSVSIGPVCIPILVYNRRSFGGGGILTDCILSIKETGKAGKLLYAEGK